MSGAYLGSIPQVQRLRLNRILIRVPSTCKKSNGNENPCANHCSGKDIDLSPVWIVDTFGADIRPVEGDVEEARSSETRSYDEESK